MLKGISTYKPNLNISCALNYNRINFVVYNYGVISMYLMSFLNFFFLEIINC